MGCALAALPPIQINPPTLRKLRPPRHLMMRAIPGGIAILATQQCREPRRAHAGQSIQRTPPLRRPATCGGGRSGRKGVTIHCGISCWRERGGSAGRRWLSKRWQRTGAGTRRDSAGPEPSCRQLAIAALTANYACKAPLTLSASDRGSNSSLLVRGLGGTDHARVGQDNCLTKMAEWRDVRAGHLQETLASSGSRFEPEPSRF